MAAEGQPQTRKRFILGPIPWFWSLLILFGVVLLVAGLMVATSSNYFVYPNPSTYGNTCDRILVKNISTTGSLLGQAGLLLLILGFFGAGAASPDLERNLRAFLFLGGAIILVVGEVFLRTVPVPYC